MIHATLHIISRPMFSSDSEEIADVVEADVNLYQSKVRPTLADLLHLPRWLARLIVPSPTSGIFDEFDIKVDKLLTERGRAPEAEPKDLVARLISARDSETGGGMRQRKCAIKWSRSHGRPRDHRAGAVVDLVSTVATSGCGKKAA